MTLKLVPPRSQNEVKLSARQCELLRWLDKGFAHKEIAARMGVALATEMTNFGHIKEKLGLATRSEVRRWAQTHTAAVAARAAPGRLPVRRALLPRPAAARGVRRAGPTARRFSHRTAVGLSNHGK